MKKTFIFYHIYCNEYTLPIVIDQITKIVFSGLYEYVDLIYCFLAGEQDYINKIHMYILNQGKKIKIADIGINDTSYERFTLLQIPKYIDDSDKFLYIHSKGITKHSSLPVYTWRNIMEYYLISKYKDCIEKLETHDAVGIMWEDKPWPHFSGNFWWSNGKYFLSLPNYINTDDYYATEAYIGSKHPNAFSFHERTHDCYYTYWPFGKYIDS